MSNLIIEQELCGVDDLASGSMKDFEVKLNNETVVKVLLIKNEEGKFSCIGSKCSHYQVPLSMGVLYKGRLRCMAHGACFNTVTGDIEDYPGPDCLPTYHVYVDPDSDKVCLRASLAQLEAKTRLRAPVSSECEDHEQADRHSPGSLPRCVIIGAGAAGLLCADTLREHGYGSNVTILTKERYPPYDRPKISKALDIKIEKVAVRTSDFYAQNGGMNLCLNEEVERIDFDEKRVVCKTGNSFDYDKLVIATGMRATGASESVPGHHLKGIFTLRSLDDANNLINYFNELRNESRPDEKLKVVFVGGSFISMEAASYFANKAETIVLSRRKPFESVFGAEVAEKVQRLHESKGVKLIVEQFEISEYLEYPYRPGSLGAIYLKNGTVVSADVCVMAIGGTPVTEFLRNTSVKLTLDNYVVVDSSMRTNVPDVYAAGDIAHFPRACLPGMEFQLSGHKLDHVSIAHWGLASSQGRIAGLDIVQQDSEMRVVPFFWSTQFNKAIRFAGYSEGHDSVVFHEDSTKQNEFKCAAFYLVDERVVAVCTIDWDPLCAVFAELMYNRIEVRREHIEKDPLDLKKLLV